MSNKNMEKKDEKDHKKEENSNEDEITFDLSRLKKFLKYNKVYMYLLIVLLLIIPIFASVHYRDQPINLDITDSWARNQIVGIVVNNELQNLNYKYPSLSAEKKQEMANNRAKEIIDSGTIEENGQVIDINQIIDDTSKGYKAQLKDEDGGTYLLAIDPYFYYRQARNYVENGYEYDIKTENGYFDTKILAGRDLPEEGQKSPVSNLHVVISAYTYKIMNFFNKDVTLMQAMFLIPLIITTLGVIPAFFIARKFSGNTGGFFSAFIFAIHPVLLSRTPAGFSDTDGYNVVFPLFIVWFFIEAVYAFEQKKYKSATIYGLLTGLTMGLFSFAWNAWFYILIFLVLGLFATIGYKFLFKLFQTKLNIKKGLLEVKNYAIAFGLLILSTGVFVSLIKSPSYFFSVIKGTISFIQLKDVGTTKIWPNVYTTVAELNPARLIDVINQISMGSRLLILLSFMGIVFALLYIFLYDNKNKKRIGTITLLVITLASAIWYYILLSFASDKVITNHLYFGMFATIPLLGIVVYTLFIAYEEKNKHLYLSPLYAFILLVWFIGTFYAASKGVRFIILLVPAFALAVGTAMGLISSIISKFFKKVLNTNKALTYFIVALLFLSVFYIPVSADGKSNIMDNVQAIANNEIPSMNDAWYNTLIKIRDNSKEDAIINSWWDFGHWFAAIADRAVTLDGGRQNSPQAHWLGKIMIEWDEKTSVGVLNYLDCGANQGFEILEEYYKGDSLKAIKTVYEILPIDREKAKEALEAKNFSEDIINQVLDNTKCDAPENYFITSEDMVGKGGVWGHFGSWDFDKAVMYNKVYNKNSNEGKKILVEEFQMTPDEAADMYKEIIQADPDRWIAGWPSFFSGEVGRCVLEENNIVSCNNQFVFNLETEEGYFDIQGAKYYPGAVSFIDLEGNFKVVEYKEKENYLEVLSGIPAGISLVPQIEELRQGGVYPTRTFTSELMDMEHVGGIFTRLFFYENVDRGLIHYKEFHKVTTFTGDKILVWKLDWNGTQEDRPFKTYSEYVKELEENSNSTEETVLQAEVVEGGNIVLN